MVAGVEPQPQTGVWGIAAAAAVSCKWGSVLAFGRGSPRQVQLAQSSKHSSTRHLSGTTTETLVSMVSLLH
jgi:hypothetical protein